MRLHEALQAARGYKVAAEDDDEMSAPLIGGIAAAGALPFAGLIRRSRPVDHRGLGDAYDDWDKFKETLKPGDLLLTADSRNTSGKWQISLPSGHPTGYHIAVVADDGNIMHFVPSNGGIERQPIDNYKPWQSATERGFSHVQVLRPEMTDEQRQLFLARLGEHEMYRDELRKAFRDRLFELREGQDEFGAKLRQLPPEHLEERARKLVNGYSENKAIMGGVREVFLPKLKTPDGPEIARQTDYARHHPDNAVPVVTERLVEGFKKMTAGDDWLDRPVTGKELVHCLPDTRTGVCSTIVGQAMNEVTKHPIATGKNPGEMIPSDFLYTNAVKPVARFTRPQNLASRRIPETLLKAGPFATRAVAGLGLAGAVYGASKFIDSDDEPAPKRRRATRLS